MSNQKPKTVLRSEIPLLGQSTNFRDAIQEVWDKMIVPNLNALGNAINMLAARVDDLEHSSKNINLFVNPEQIQKLFQPNVDAKRIEEELAREEAIENELDRKRLEAAEPKPPVTDGDTPENPATGTKSAENQETT